MPESEDCLFLDVVVPTSVYHNHGRQLAPVLVNIHGGGFFIGDKNTLYDPQGLLAAAKNEMIFVSMNYRVSCPLPRLSHLDCFSDTVPAYRLRIAWWPW